MSNQPTWHPLKSKATSIPKHPPLQQRVSCGVYITMCPLACKQKTQPKQKGAPGTAGRLAQLCILPGRGLRRWGMSSRHPLPLVARRSCSSELRGVLQAQSPSASPRAEARSPPPGAARSRRSPGGSGRLYGSTGTPCGGQERRGGGKAGAARPASPVGKSFGSLLLAKANTALFFRDRANAPSTGAGTRGAPAKRSASSGEGAALAEPPPPGQILKTAGHAGSAPRPAGHTPGRRGRERPHHLRAACPKDVQPGNPGSPLSAEASAARTSCGLQEPLLQRRRRAAAPEPGTFPAWIPAKPTRSLAEGVGGQRSAGGKHERRAALGRGISLQSAGKPRRGHDGGDVLGTREGESFGERRIDRGGPSWNGGGESLAWGHGRTCKFQGRERVSEGPEGSGRLRGLPFPPTR